MKTFLPIAMWVVLGAALATPASSHGADPSPYGDRLTVDLSAEPSLLYSNQVFQLTLRVHSMDLTYDPSIVYNDLFEGGRIVRMSEFKEMLPERKIHGNRLRETRRFVCSARATAIGPVELAPVATITVYERRASFFGPARFERPVTVRAASLTLVVHPIPRAGRPASWSGAVGRLGFDVKVEPSDVAVNDLIKIRMLISGSANLAGVSAPALDPGPHFKTYPPIPLTGLASNTQGFEQTVVPLSLRAAGLPAISFSFFDPIASEYRTITHGPFPLKFHERLTPVDDGSKPSVTILAREETSGSTADHTSDRWISQINRLARALEDGTIFKPVATTVAASTRARLAPAASALGLFDIPPGSKVHVVESWNDWTKVSFNRNRGWIPSAAIQSRPEGAPAP